MYQPTFAGLPMRYVSVKDLKPIQGAGHIKPRPKLQALSDDELLESVQNPQNGDYLTENTRTGTLVDGNGRDRTPEPRSRSE